jgi:fatty-acyl-CoA synthase
MEIPLTPVEFGRRARRLYAEREAVVDGELRLTYEQFLERCDRWSSALQALGVRKGDRVAYIAPNTHAHLEGYYAVPQIGAVLVPMNYRLLPDDFEYIINHCGAKVVCAHADYLEAVDGIRGRLAGVEHFVALEGLRDGWIDYESTLGSHSQDFARADIAETDLMTINYTSGTTARPKGVMITHRNAYMNVMGTLVHHHLTPADRYLWTLPMFHANGWTFTWINTARGIAHVCLRQVEPRLIFQLIKDEKITMLCAAPTVLIGIANAPDDVRAGAPSGVRLFTAGAPPAAATIELVERELGWELTHVYGMTEASPLITFCEPLPEHRKLSLTERAEIKARQGVELVSSGELRVVDEHGNHVPRDGQSLGEIVVRGNVVMKGYYNDPEATNGRLRTVGTTRATPRSFTPTVTWKSETVSRTSSSAAARTFPRSRSKRACCATWRCGKSPSSACRMRSGGKRLMPSSSCARAPRRRKRSSNFTHATVWPTSRHRNGSASSTSCQRRRRVRYRSSYFGRAKPASRGNSGRNGRGSHSKSHCFEALACRLVSDKPGMTSLAQLGEMPIAVRT